MNFFKFLNFSLKSTKISVGLRFQLASVTINFTDNRDYRAVLYSMVLGGDRVLVSHWGGLLASFLRPGAALPSCMHAPD